MVHADHILRLQDDLAPDEMPPDWMWPLQWEMERWLERIIKERKARFGTGGDDDVDRDWDENELAAEWKKKAAV